jgi:hypothetical protein
MAVNIVQRLGGPTNHDCDSSLEELGLVATQQIVAFSTDECTFQDKRDEYLLPWGFRLMEVAAKCAIRPPYDSDLCLSARSAFRAAA